MIPLSKQKRLSGIALGLVGLVILSSGCSKDAEAKGSAPPPSLVQVAVVEQADVPVVREWIGTLDGMVNAAIQAQASGYVTKQHYTEGSYVRKGTPLFEIDSRPLQAALEQAEGQLAQARGQLAQVNAQAAQAAAQLAQTRANQGRTQLDEDRYAPLAKEQAITQQEFDNAKQNNLSAKAEVEASRAGVATAEAAIEAAKANVQAAQAAVNAARVNRGFTQLVSPIDGIVGNAQIQVGNLVGPATGTITTVSTVDPIKATFSVSEQEYLEFSKKPKGDLARMQLDLILADGTTYAHKGRFLFADREVNPATGAILLTGVFPNPGNVLRPGQYGRVRAVVAENPGALLVPQRAVTELQGRYMIAVVDNANKVSIREITPGQRLDTRWVISKGLQAGERVIADGGMKAPPGAVVNPQPYKRPAGGGQN